jgi:hypothetical protein
MAWRQMPPLWKENLAHDFGYAASIAPFKPRICSSSDCKNRYLAILSIGCIFHRFYFLNNPNNISDDNPGIDILFEFCLI